MVAKIEKIRLSEEVRKARHLFKQFDLGFISLQEYLDELDELRLKSKK